MDRSRLEAFSDGVFAVAITLLALDLTVAGPGPHNSNPPLLDQLDGRWPAFLAYLISFFMIGIVWVNHHVLVKSITAVDRTLLFQRVARPLPSEKHWAARARFVGGGLVYVCAIVVALFSAVAAFVLIALVAVYYIVERTPAAPGDADSGGDDPVF